MAGAYLEIDPQETYTFSANVLLSNVAQELATAAVWFQAFSDDDYANTTPFINASTAGGQIAISNANTAVNSVVTVTLASNVTGALGQVNVGAWVLVANVAGRVYKLDSGRICVLPNVGVNY